ncbi:bifunctional allantoicase/(S)-ureidoglycine aminohydrolase [Candidatus Pantoea formicae]|uniref:bifunctional allantoicase/(S)-ureidoglycine aminohydrolase n=1 Tax=Candidatus Pantoea formicae TaxID=2608355 RepID=UPI003EDB1A67
MEHGSYYAPHGGLDGQKSLLTGRSVFTEAYAFIPRGVMSDIVTSQLPFWQRTRLWVLSRPMSGFSETFSHYIMEVGPQGGSDRPESDPAAQSALFILEGHIHLTVEGTQHDLVPGSFVYIPAGAQWQIKNTHSEAARFNWIRKIWQPLEGLEKPPFMIANERDITPTAMPDTGGRWATTRFVDVNDMRHDMHITIVTFQPGGLIPFMETHVMEHGLYVLQGKGVYKLNEDWIEVEPGDYMWLRAFCPQACYAGGDEPFRYLLYKDMNRHADLHLLK